MANKPNASKLLWILSIRSSLQREEACPIWFIIFSRVKRMRQVKGWQVGAKQQIKDSDKPSKTGTDTLMWEDKRDGLLSPHPNGDWKKSQ